MPMIRPGTEARTTHARRFRAFLLAACWPCAAVAAFDPTDVIQVETFATLAKDDNVFRLPDLDPEIFFGIPRDRTSDVIRNVGLGLKLDKMISRQRILGDVRVSDVHYQKNSQLDHTSYNAQLAWEWAVGNLWRGELEARRREYLAGFADSGFRGKDIITADSYRFTGGYQFHPRWRISGAVGFREYTHSAAVNRSTDFEGKSASVRLTYHTPAENSLGLLVRRAEGDYPNRVLPGLPLFDRSFSETEVNALLNWRLAGDLSLNGEMGWTERKHKNFSERDFSGFTGRATASWDITGKVRLTVIGSRDIRSLEDQISNYVLVNSVQISPIWSITSKVFVRGSLIRETREYSGDPGIITGGVEAREDTLKTARLGITYSPLRYLDLTLSYERGDRKSNRVLTEYEYELLFGAVSLRF